MACGGGLTAASLNEENIDPLLQGKTLYSNNCAQCHGHFSESNKKFKSENQISAAIQNVTQMSFLKNLDSNKIAMIAEALMEGVVESEDFTVISPRNNASVTSSFIINGKCILGLQIALSGDFGTKLFTCNGNYSFVVSNLQSGIKTFKVTQQNPTGYIELNRSVIYTVADPISDSVEQTLNNSCTTSGEDVALNPIKRMSKIEYINSLKTLFFDSHWNLFYPSIQSFIDSIPNDQVMDSITTYMRFSKTKSEVKFEHIDQFHKIAEAVSIYFGTIGLDQQRRIFGNCFFYDNTQITCAESFIRSFGLKTFSRPVSTAEFNDARAIYLAETSSRLEGLKSVIYYFLMSPQFLFHMEIESNQSADVITLTQFEIARKISFLITSELPDAYMLNLAQTGQLLSSAQRIAAVNYLVTTYPDKTKETYWQFIKEWLGKNRNEQFPSSSKLSGMVNGLFNPSTQGEEVREGMKDELRKMFEYYTFTNPSGFSEILTNSNSFSTNTLVSSLNGVAAWNGTGAPQNFPANQKRGFLTSSALLTTGGTSNNPFHVGGMIYKHILCREFGNTPAPQDLIPGDNTGQLKTTRDHFSSLTPNGSSCMNCHSQINPLGFPFEDYDFLGRHRNGFEKIYNTNGEEINQLQVDATSTPYLAKRDIAVTGALDLIQKIDQSKESHACFAKQYFRFANYRKDTPEDSCSIKRAYQAIKTGTVLDMIKSIVADDNFIKRRINP